MSLYSSPNFDNDPNLIARYIALCDNCFAILGTPTDSGIRMPSGWNTFWVHATDERLDTCQWCVANGQFATKSYDGQNAGVNMRLTESSRRLTGRDAKCAVLTERTSG